ncbi:MAG: hypothetical protein ACYTGB_02110, partial [Planctomycetota bacterium]
MNRAVAILAAGVLLTAPARGGEEPGPVTPGRALSFEEAVKLARDKPEIVVSAHVPDGQGFGSGSGSGFGSVCTPRGGVYYIYKCEGRGRRRRVTLRIVVDPSACISVKIPKDPAKAAREWAASLPLDEGLKLSERQVKKVAGIATENVRKLEAYLRDMEGFLAALEDCRRAPDDPQAARQLCTLLPKVSNQPESQAGFRSVFTPEQRRCITRKELESPVGRSRSWSEEINFKGRIDGSYTSEGRFEAGFSSRGGKWLCRISFTGRADQLLERLAGISDEMLGEVLTCAVDRSLRRKAISGSLEFGSM